MCTVRGTRGRMNTLTLVRTLPDSIIDDEGCISDASATISVIAGIDSSICRTSVVTVAFRTIMPVSSPRECSMRRCTYAVRSGHRTAKCRRDHATTDWTMRRIRTLNDAQCARLIPIQIQMQSAYRTSSSAWFGQQCALAEHRTYVGHTHSNTHTLSSTHRQTEMANTHTHTYCMIRAILSYTVRSHRVPLVGSHTCNRSQDARWLSRSTTSKQEESIRR